MKSILNNERIGLKNSGEKVSAMSISSIVSRQKRKFFLKRAYREASKWKNNLKKLYEGILSVLKKKYFQAMKLDLNKSVHEVVYNGSWYVLKENFLFNWNICHRGSKPKRVFEQALTHFWSKGKSSCQNRMVFVTLIIAPWKLSFFSISKLHHCRSTGRLEIQSFKSRQS